MTIIATIRRGLADTKTCDLRPEIAKALKSSGHNVSRAATTLGVSESELRRLIKADPELAATHRKNRRRGRPPLSNDERASRLEERAKRLLEEAKKIRRGGT